MEREVEAVRKGSVGVVGGVCVVPGGETGLRTSCGRGTNCPFHLGFLACNCHPRTVVGPPLASEKIGANPRLPAYIQ